MTEKRTFVKPDIGSLDIYDWVLNTSWYPNNNGRSSLRPTLYENKPRFNLWSNHPDDANNKKPIIIKFNMTNFRLFVDAFREVIENERPSTTSVAIYRMDYKEDGSKEKVVDVKLTLKRNPDLMIDITVEKQDRPAFVFPFANTGYFKINKNGSELSESEYSTLLARSWIGNISTFFEKNIHDKHIPEELIRKRRDEYKEQLKQQRENKEAYGGLTTSTSNGETFEDIPY